MKITFLGGAGTVTGSKILLESNNKNILIDCGLFQGLDELRKKNWDKLPINAASIDSVLLTHAHLDHSGYLPKLVKNGFTGKIYCTQATRDLTEIILLDSGKIQEEDTRRANEHHYSKHAPAEPLYTIEDAQNTMAQFSIIKVETWHNLSENIKFQFKNSGHILGSAFIELRVADKTIVFSGDLGRKNPIFLPKYQYIDQADYLIVESTYGNRVHKNISIKNELLRCIKHTYSKGGILIIPTFAVERAQEIIYLLSLLKRENLLPKIPIYLDSPMGVNVTEIYFKYKNIHKLTNDDIKSMLDTVDLISDIKDSKAIVADTNPKIVLAGSGMVTGGRVLHYLNKTIADQKNSILIVGYQAEGTRGRALISGDSEVKFFGEYHPIRAEVFEITDFSGHADQSEIMDWLKHIKNPPTLTFINHGEAHESQTLRTKIKSELQWKCTVAKPNNEYYLD
jgi:metallo-beta-lactamase family protein